MTVFTWRDSGGFYLEPPGRGFDPEVEYLLFLVAAPDGMDLPSGASGVVVVNYSCGQSKPWNEVSVDDRRAVYALAR